MIPAQLIAQIREQTDIVEIVRQRCRLVVSYGGTIGPCPFHADDRHHLSVDSLNRRFECIECGAAGDVFEFVRRFDALSLGEAIRSLGARAGIEVPEGEPEYSPISIRGPSALVFAIRRAGVFVDARACVGEVVRVGKVASAQLRLPDDAEGSRLHAVIEIIDEGVRLIDLGSATGTVINGTVVRTRHMLEPGDRLRFGEYEAELVEVFHRGADQPAAAPAQAAAWLCTSEAVRAAGEQRFAEVHSALRAAWQNVHDDALQQVSRQLDRMLGNSPPDWPKVLVSRVRWLDQRGLAQLDGLRRSLLRLGSRSDEAQTIAMEMAVLLDPRDDVPRQVYADWLQQHGDPRGELIMLQLADASGQLDEAGHARIEELLEAHGRTWMAEFTALGADLEFQRGFSALVRHRGPWSVALIELVRRSTTIESIEGTHIPALLAARA